MTRIYRPSFTISPSSLAIFDISFEASSLLHPLTRHCHDMPACRRHDAVLPTLFCLPPFSPPMPALLRLISDIVVIIADATFCYATLLRWRAPPALRAVAAMRDMLLLTPLRAAAHYEDALFCFMFHFHC